MHLFIANDILRIYADDFFSPMLIDTNPDAVPANAQDYPRDRLYSSAGQERAAG